MHVFRHHYKTNQCKPVSFPHIYQHLHKQIPRPDASQQLLPSVTRKGNEVQVPVAVNPNQFISHVLGTEEPHPYQPKGCGTHSQPHKFLLDELPQWYHALVCGVTEKKRQSRTKDAPPAHL
jgi:hypothetical protein